MPQYVWYPWDWLGSHRGRKWLKWLLSWPGCQSPVWGLEEAGIPNCLKSPHLASLLSATCTPSLPVISDSLCTFLLGLLNLCSSVS